jgi:hypothetical protein
MLAGYFVAFAVGVLRWRAQVRAESSAGNVQQQDAGPQVTSPADDAPAGR